MVNYFDDYSNCDTNICKSTNCYIDKDSEWDADIYDYQGYTCDAN